MWSAAARELLYCELVRQFGPLDEWTTSNRPGRGLDKKFVAFCAAFAALVGAKSANAVQHQIAFAVMTTVPESRSLIANLMLNKAAAYHAGFISFGRFPGLSNGEIEKRQAA